MIKSIHIANFQSHKETLLDLNPGVNVITGSSDSGKTAIIRALRWLIWNRPSGDAFRSTWGGDTKISCTLSNLTSFDAVDNLITIIREKGDAFRSTWGGDTKISCTLSNLTSFDAVDNLITIIREKGAENIYEILGLIDLGEKKLEGFGTEVPEDVQKILNIDETNLQMQLDQPFLISNSSGEVAGYLNRIAHLDQIDSGLRNIQSWLRKLLQREESDQERIGQLEKELSQFDYLDKFEVDLEVLEQDQKQLTSLSTCLNKLISTVKEISAVSEEIEQVSQLLSLREKVDFIFELRVQRGKVVHNKTNLESKINAVTHLEGQISDLNNLTALSPTVEGIVGKWRDLTDVGKDKQSLSNLLNEIISIKKKERELFIEIKGLENQFQEEMPETCPLCGHKYKQIKTN